MSLRHPLAPVLLLATACRLPARVYAAALFEGSYRSSDGGSTWTRNGEALTGGAGTPIHALRSDPGSATTIYAATDAGVFRNRDSGASWVPTRNGLGARRVRHLWIDPHDPRHLFARTETSGLWDYTEAP